MNIFTKILFGIQSTSDDSGDDPSVPTVPESAEVIVTPNVRKQGGLSLISEGSAQISEKIGLSFEIPFVELKQEPWNNTEERVGLNFDISYLNLYRDYAPITTDTDEILTTDTNETIDIILK